MSDKIRRMDAWKKHAEAFLSMMNNRNPNEVWYLGAFDPDYLFHTQFLGANGKWFDGKSFTIPRDVVMAVHEMKGDSC